MARGKHAKKSNGWIVWAILLVILLAVGAYFGRQLLPIGNMGAGTEKPEPDIVQQEVTPSEEEQQIPNPYGIDPQKPMIALTFDDGPSQYTWDIVKTLADHHARATFFVIGNRVETHQAAIEYVLANHNEIGSHTFDNSSLKGVSREEIWAQVENTDWIMWDKHSYRISLVRLPYDSETTEALDVLKEKEHPAIHWSLDSSDWSSKDKNAIVETVLANVKDGDIVLLHDIYEPTAQAVAEIVPQLSEQGYQLVTVSELLQWKGITPENGRIHYSAIQKQE